MCVPGLRNEGNIIGNSGQEQQAGVPTEIWQPTLMRGGWPEESLSLHTQLRRGLFSPGTERNTIQNAIKPAARKHSGPPARRLNIYQSVQAQDGLDALLHVVGSDNGVVANFRMQ